MKELKPVVEDVTASVPSRSVYDTPSRKQTASSGHSVTSRSPNSSLAKPSIRTSILEDNDNLSSINASVTQDDLSTILVSESLHDLEPDMKQAMRRVQDVHLAKLSSYRRLLSEKDSASARSLHDLHVREIHLYNLHTIFYRLKADIKTYG